jgi:predicted ATPase
MQYLFERTSSRLYEMRSEAYLTGRLDRIGAAASA